MDTSNYEKLKKDADIFYSEISKVHSPALKQEIVFNRENLMKIK